MAYIQFLGAAGTVTGSKHLINTGDPSGKSGFQVLVDCGLFQGPKEWRERNWRETPVPAKAIDAVILTHAHLDHCGWIPRLVKEGFRGPIYATAPTIDFAELFSRLRPPAGRRRALLQQDKEIEARACIASLHLRRGAGLPAILPPVAVGRLHTTIGGAFFPFRPRGAHSRIVHGGALVRANGRTHRLLFSGDIGRVHDHKVAPGKVVHSGPEEGEIADIVVMESTYGNRMHPKEDPLPELAELIRTRPSAAAVSSFQPSRLSARRNSSSFSST